MKNFFAIPDNTLNNKLTQILSQRQFLVGKNEVSKDFSILSNDLLELYSTIFFKGNVNKARSALDATNSDMRTSDTVVISLFAGFITILLMFCAYFCKPTNGGPNANSELSSSIYVFFVTFVFVWILFATGLSIQIWKSYHINYEYLFGIDPNYRMFHLQFYKVALIFLFVWMFFLVWQIVKMKMPTQFFNDYATFSLCCFLFFIVLCMMPFPVLQSSARWSLARNLGKVLISPIPKVKFRDFILADIITSMITPIQEVASIYCYFAGPDQDWKSGKKVKFVVWTHRDSIPPVQCYVANKIYVAIPFIIYWFRFAQCMRRAVSEKNNK